jgi:hypothetical protein
MHQNKLICAVFRVPISVEKRLAIAMALHPALAPDSQLFQIASIPVNALKAGKRPSALPVAPCSILAVFSHISRQSFASLSHVTPGSPLSFCWQEKL